MHITYPVTRLSDYHSLKPSIHWAQQHMRGTSFSWERRIYDFELLYVVQGEISATVGEIEYFIPASRLLFIPAGINHKISILTEPGTQLLGIHFDFFDDLLVLRDEDIIVNEEHVAVNNFCVKPSFNGIEFFAGDPVITPPSQVISLMEFIIHEFNERKLGFELACEGMLMQIFSLLIRFQEDRRRMVHHKYEKPLMELAHEMETHFNQNWSSVEMAKQININEDYMCKLFKDLIGMTPNKYLQYLRHQHAKKLLRFALF
jgi:hypothetical protein